MTKQSDKIITIIPAEGGWVAKHPTEKNRRRLAMWALVEKPDGTRKILPVPALKDSPTLDPIEGLYTGFEYDGD